MIDDILDDTAVVLYYYSKSTGTQGPRARLLVPNFPVAA